MKKHTHTYTSTSTYYKAEENVADWFDYEQNGCRVLPHKLLSMIRKYFPRDEESNQPDYPPPFTNEGGVGGEVECTDDDCAAPFKVISYPYPLEFVNLVGTYVCARGCVGICTSALFFFFFSIFISAYSQLNSNSRICLVVIQAKLAKMSKTNSPALYAPRGLQPRTSIPNI